MMCLFLLMKEVRKSGGTVVCKERWSAGFAVMAALTGAQLEVKDQAQRIDQGHTRVRDDSSRGDWKHGGEREQEAGARSP